MTTEGFSHAILRYQEAYSLQKQAWARVEAAREALTDAHDTVGRADENLRAAEAALLELAQASL